VHALLKCVKMVVKEEVVDHGAWARGDASTGVDADVTRANSEDQCSAPSSGY
jgi:hypothetical protein